MMMVMYYLEINVVARITANFMERVIQNLKEMKHAWLYEIMLKERCISNDEDCLDEM